MTPAYAALAAERVAHIHRLAPGAKIIFFMRNPIERAWSHAGMHVRQGFISDESNAILSHFRSDDSLRRTEYLETIDIWTRFFPVEQIFVGFAEDLRFHPRELLSRICAFLGIEDVAEWPYMNDLMYGRSEATIPASFLSNLAALHSERSRQLSRFFGGYADWWSYCCERLTRPPSEAEVAFPLYETELWVDWLDGESPRLQSDILGRALQSARATPHPGT
jgi:hypothetical protein